MGFHHNYHLESEKTEKIFRKILEEEKIKILLKELRDHHPDTFLHSLRVCLLALDLGIENKLEDKKLEILAYGALLHDIGKKEISLLLLEKPDKLAPPEKMQMEQHTRLALKKIADFEDEIKFLVVGSHECQKNPYPRKEERRKDCRGTERRKNANTDLKQILAIADWYDALRNSRAYKKPKDKLETEKILREEYTGNQKYISQIITR
ncbi:HD domain protein [uncultured archaeon]|nr:HD domain protein [uncultured archaeon]